MAKVISKATLMKAEGSRQKFIEEFIGLYNSKNSEISIAKVKSPPGWIEPGQTPEFTEYSAVLEGTLHIKTKEEEFDIEAGQSVIINAGEWVQYSTPQKNGADYLAVCLPSFSSETVHRDSSEYD